MTLSRLASVFVWRRIGKQIVGELHDIRAGNGGDVGKFADESVTQRGDGRECVLSGVESHGVLVEGFVVRVVTDGLFDDRDRSGRITVAEQFGEGEVGVDRLPAGGFPDRWYPVVVVVAGQRAGVGGDRGVQRSRPGIGGGCGGRVVEVSV